MQNESESALTRLFAQLPIVTAMHGETYLQSATVALARAELAALRERCADLEALVRWITKVPHSKPKHRELIRIEKDYVDENRPLVLVEWDRNGLNKQRFEMEDDGTGLPLLTHAARAALSPR